MKTTRVLKYGGSSFPSLEAYAEIAENLERRLNSDSERLVVVVSAMSGTTGNLLNALLKVNPEASAEITDSILGTGEIVAACLLRAALEKRGIPASHCSGYQLGIRTSSQFTRARIREIDRDRLRRKVEATRVLVVSGGQAVDSEGRMTMLGRNSSDLSAVALAGALGLPECEIFSDVPGVYSADPYSIPNAALLREMPYDSIIALSRGGAKVLHHGAVSYAKDAGVRILCRSTRDGEVGSRIGCGSIPKAIAANSRIVALEYADETTAREAEAHFESEGIVAAIAPFESRTTLAVSQENRGWIEAVRRLPSPPLREIDSLTLVTTIEPLIGERRFLIPSSLAPAWIARIHERMYPIDFAEKTSKSFAKARAKESDLLVAH